MGVAISPHNSQTTFSQDWPCSSRSFWLKANRYPHIFRCKAVLILYPNKMVPQQHLPHTGFNSFFTNLHIYFYRMCKGDVIFSPFFCPFFSRSKGSYSPSSPTGPTTPGKRKESRG